MQINGAQAPVLYQGVVVFGVLVSKAFHAWESWEEVFPSTEFVPGLPENFGVVEPCPEIRPATKLRGHFTAASAAPEAPLLPRGF